MLNLIKISTLFILIISIFSLQRIGTEFNYQKSIEKVVVDNQVEGAAVAFSNEKANDKVISLSFSFSLSLLSELNFLINDLSRIIPQLKNKQFVKNAYDSQFSGISPPFFHLA